MNITRANYEIYFIDYLDGNLSDTGIRMLENFLLLNPDLRNELEGLEKTYLKTDKEIFPLKDLMQRPDVELPITNNNFEDFCIASIEDDLDKIRSEKFREYCDAHPESFRIYLIFKKLHLIPVLSERYPQKNKLKRSVKLISNEFIYTAISIAAMIVVVYFIFNEREKFYFQDEKPQTAQIQAETDINLNSITGTDKKIPEVSPLPTNKTEFSGIQKKSEKNPGIIEKEIFPVNMNGTEFEQNKISEVHNLKDLTFEINIPVYPKNEIIKPDIKSEKFTEESRSTEKYINLKEYAKQEFSEKILGKKETTGLTVWDLADAGIDGISRITGSNIELEKATNKEGKINKVIFESKYISFYTSKNK